MNVTSETTADQVFRTEALEKKTHLPVSTHVPGVSHDSLRGYSVSVSFMDKELPSVSQCHSDKQTNIYFSALFFFFFASDALL